LELFPPATTWLLVWTDGATAFTFERVARASASIRVRGRLAPVFT
jgi:hypothetical protein